MWILPIPLLHMPCWWKTSNMFAKPMLLCAVICFVWMLVNQIPKPWIVMLLLCWNTWIALLPWNPTLPTTWVHDYVCFVVSRCTCWWCFIGQDFWGSCFCFSWSYFLVDEWWTLVPCCCLKTPRAMLLPYCRNINWWSHDNDASCAYMLAMLLFGCLLVGTSIDDDVNEHCWLQMLCCYVLLFTLLNLVMNIDNDEHMMLQLHPEFPKP